ncbi:Short-chain dehydrogenase [Actinacidiphila glaucinigra]|uniref:Short-chain dehydrogenase n=1 Tax=Actinacidiphila glaucinigra TaxID=235986 RepID=A0A239G124_9ACTN|nr:Short-chain dehydrogenase [Actinacidiphila glaucinigra]
MHRTFFITAVGSGLGRAFAQEALAAGHRVIGTVRRPDQVAEFEALAPGRATGRVLDVTDEDAVVAVVDEAERNVGPIEVLISNAGYGLEGTVEESSMGDLRRQFDVNVFGSVAVIKAVLPHMRRRRGGHIFSVSSMAGLTALPGVAFYGASKFAMEGVTASLAQEVAGFGIRVTSLALGSFRTDWAGRSMVRAPSPTTTPSSNRSAPPAGPRAASRPATRPAPPGPCSGSWSPTTRPCTSFSVPTPCAWSSRGSGAWPATSPRGPR